MCPEGKLGLSLALYHQPPCDFVLSTNSFRISEFDMTFGITWSNSIIEQMRGKNKKDSPGRELTGLELPNSEEQKKGPGDRGYKCPHPEDNIQVSFCLQSSLSLFFFFLTIYLMKQQGCSGVCPRLDFADCIPVVQLTCSLKMELLKCANMNIPL